MAHARLVCEINDDFGYKGWRLKRHPTFFPVTPEGVSHDLLEHYPADQGRVMEEIRAQGASAFVQVESGLVEERGATRFRLAESLASTILFTLRDSQWVRGKLPAIVAHRRPVEISTLYARRFSEVEACIRALWNDELDIEYAEENNGGSFTFDEVMAPRWNQALNMLHEGYRWAAERYGNVDHAAYLFRGIDRLSTSLLPMAEVGDEMVMHYMLRDERVEATLTSGGRIMEQVRYH
ncbi:hypothetical protein [Burkholderia cenocepacia]|uniref:hypothetical protein n=1 Tax=Burkholderia cenocepacia TaxID=95486 RepID=UPI0007612512|nr:hypothetical protein [Burkholderia cenocepacia]KWU23399.1 hypothetical protein AS149_37050 [Burkholderia cenocepacia]